MKVNETESQIETNPKKYSGPPSVDKTTGQFSDEEDKEDERDDKKYHVDPTKPSSDETPAPKINPQAEALRKAFADKEARVLAERAKTMDEKKLNEKSKNLPLANELMDVGLVNNVKGTAKVLREENPMRKAMEIYYNSEKTNSVNENKPYVPTVLGGPTKERKPIDMGTTPITEKKEEVKKKKLPIIW